MRAYLIDEISPDHMEKINDFLKKNGMPSNLDQIFWIKIPEDYLNETQSEHTNCQPHVFAVEIGSDWVKLEFFVRSHTKMECTCTRYCTTKQMSYVIKFANGMIEKLGIAT